MVQLGAGVTVNTTSSVFMHPAESVTVRRIVTDALVTWTVVGPKVMQFEQDVGEFGSNVAVPLPGTTLHCMEVMGLIPSVALPVIVKSVEAPWLHLV